MTRRQTKNALDKKFKIIKIKPKEVKLAGALSEQISQLALVIRNPLSSRQTMMKACNRHLAIPLHPNAAFHKSANAPVLKVARACLLDKKVARAKISSEKPAPRSAWVHRVSQFPLRESQKILSQPQVTLGRRYLQLKMMKRLKLSLRDRALRRQLRLLMLVSTRLS